ncbi:DNA cytosine methyltransferase [Brevibacillus laterosporus]|uniref:Cytosine-specific methyltransferase n=1 Tax=Brevibacillus laterosporus TaxID=1465 RepID=A0AAP3DE15_BRELA|nr:DNA cytosine methyltransferase [Brevibacillus laterosporus]MCR8979388.1 DNA cytosine methyltransferase [Brevibacillus laterosporus]MCZ0806543.1 DNA cytosine methyltransferase [Brevibacillus laterosporus]MCZ0824991.1 DNA cytosine methyltransferase [Brevibacillus laterosporus]MCZ0849854.1 DNA cytosine methyltransferase [Brevibacillus laterosporus]
MIFKKGEFFNGPGGIALGAKMAKIVDKNGIEYGIKHEWSNDIDESACKTFIHNICPDHPETVINQDVRELNIDDLSEIDAFTFGFPCNDYSNVGEKKGLSGDYGPLYTYGVKVLRTFRPKWFIAENVSGLTSANEGKAFNLIMRDLVESGYEVTPHLYKFQDYGIPQTRHRIIIVGIRKDLGLKFKVPAPTHGENRLPYKTAKQALTEPPIKPDAFNHELTRHTAKVIEFLNHIPPGENAWYNGIPEHLRLNVKGAKMSQIYRRLHPDYPAYTVTGSGGGGTHIYHWDETRALTNRERARLQTFPDDFIFLGGKEKVRQQIGMAVPPEGAKIIIEAILKTFAGIKYDSIDSKWDVEELLLQNRFELV